MRSSSLTPGQLAAAVIAAAALFGTGYLAGWTRAAPAATPPATLGLPANLVEFDPTRPSSALAAAPTVPPSPRTSLRTDAAAAGTCALPPRTILQQAFEKNARGPLDALAAGRLTRAMTNLLLRSGKPLEALELLRQSPASGPRAYRETAKALFQAGHRDEAIEMYGEALRRDLGDEEIHEELAALDPAAHLRVLAGERQRSAGSYYDEEIARGRAIALHALGRDGEAVLLVCEHDDKFTRSDDWPNWEWEVRMTADPRGVEKLLEKELEKGGDEQERALVLYARLLHREGRMKELERRGQDWCSKRRGRKGAGRMLANLAPYQGWQPVRDFLAEHPEDSGAGWALGDHLASQGRQAEALTVWRELLEAQGDSLDAETLLETVRRAPAQLMSMLDAHRARLETRGHSEVFLPDELGELGEANWQLGRRAEAVSLWRRALALCPDDDYWKRHLRAVELGQDPLFDDWEEW